MIAKSVLVVVVALATSASIGQAQVRPRRESQLPRGGLGRQEPALRQENRQQLQRRVQQAIWKMTKRRVGLTDDQMARLAPVHQRFESRRRNLTREERQTRVALRDALRDSTHVDQAQVSAYLDHLVQIQKQRSELIEDEQKELAQFMTPVQRARYTALQEQVRLRIQQLARRNQAAAAPDSAPSGPPRP